MPCSAKEFYLTIVRHGQTEANDLKIIQGHSDTPLTKLGLEQARALSEYMKIKQIKYDCIYSSDLGRAYDTCKILTSPSCNGIVIHKDKRLRERKLGAFEGKTLVQLQEEAYKRGFNQANFTEYIPQGAESLLEVRQRVNDFFLNTLLKESKHGEEVLIVSHWATIKEFLKLFQPHANGSIREEHFGETPNVALSKFRVYYRPSNVDSHNGSRTRPTAEINNSTLNIEVVFLHQTSYLKVEQISVNLAHLTK